MGGREKNVTVFIWTARLYGKIVHPCSNKNWKQNAVLGTELVTVLEFLHALNWEQM